MDSTNAARERFAIQSAVRHRILDLAPAERRKLTAKLQDWHALDFDGFRKEVKRAASHGEATCSRSPRSPKPSPPCSSLRPARRSSSPIIRSSTARPRQSPWQWSRACGHFLHPPARNFLLAATHRRWADCHSSSSGLPTRRSPLTHGVRKDRADIADIDACGLCDRQSASSPYAEPRAVVAHTVAEQPAQGHWFDW